MKKLLFLALLGFAPLTFASADLKVAVIDLGKAFDSYYKTKDAQTRLQSKQAQAQRDYKDLVTDYQHMSDSAQKLKDQANDPTLAADAKKDKQAALQAKVQDLMNMERKIEETKVQRQRELQDEIVRRHKEILEEITKVVSDYSGPQGFDVVLDRSGSSTSGVPLLLFTSSRLIDITPDIITKLNASQPRGITPGAVPTGASAPGTSPGTTH